MKKSIYGLLLLLAGGLFSCKPEPFRPAPCPSPPCTDDPDPVTKLDTLWTYLIDEGERTSVVQNMEIYKDKLIVAFDLNSRDRSIRAFDIDNRGKLLWRNAFENGVLSNKTLHEEGLIYNKSGSRRASIEIESGQIVEQIRSDQYSGARAFFIERDMYFYEANSGRGDDSVWIYRTNYKDLSKKELVYTLTKDYAPSDRKSIESANLWVNPSTGDSILIFQHRMSLPNRVDVIAWNMSRKDFEWKHDDLTKYGQSGVPQITIIENKAYFMGGAAMYCFDMFNGDIRWQFNHPADRPSFGFYQIAYDYDKNILIVKDTGSELYAFDADTGATIWVNNDAGYSSIITGSPKYHAGMIYYAAFGSLHAVRAEDGKTVWAEKSVYDYQSQYNGEIAIDPERGCLYVSNRKSLIAVKLYEE